MAASANARMARAVMRRVCARSVPFAALLQYPVMFRSSCARGRRRFLLRTPLAAAGLAAGCRARGGTPDASAGGTLASSPAARPAPLLRDVPAGAPVLRWTPAHTDLVYTFGGAA